MGQGKGRFAVPLVAVLVLVGLAMAAPAPVRAATTYYVGNGGDTSSGGQCANAANTTCTLREAIGAAAAGDTITFKAGVTAVTLTSDQFSLTRNVTIAGPTGGATVRRNASAGAFRILTVNSGVTANLSNLTIRGGSDASGAGGGGIYNNGGTTTLANVTVSGNTSGGLGGGIYLNGGTVTLTNSTVSGNTGSLAAAASQTAAARSRSWTAP